MSEIAHRYENERALRSICIAKASAILCRGSPEMLHAAAASAGVAE
jgi:hypothetical protein